MILVSQDINSTVKKIVGQYNAYLNSGLGLQGLTRINFNNNTDKLLSELLMSYLVKLESISPGSSEIFISMINENHDVKCEPYILTSENIHSLLRTYSDEVISSIVHESLNLAGLYGKVVIGNSIVEGNKDVVELSYGSYFSDVYPAIKLKNSKFVNPKVIVIDGFIESVSEVHRILEDSNRLKETVFLFIRGLSEEVTHTLKVNNDRGTLCVLPIITKYDLKGANILNDIAVVSGCDVISTLKGQLISNVDITNSNRVDSIMINELGVLIENKNTNSYVNQHIRFLQEKVINASNDAEIDIISSRIKNLGSNRVTILLKNDNNKKKRSFMIDQCLRAVKLSTTYGLIKFKDKTYPYSSMKAALHYRQKFNELVDSVGCCLIQ